MPGSAEDPGGIKHSSSVTATGRPFSNGILYSTSWHGLVVTGVGTVYEELLGGWYQLEEAVVAGKCQGPVNLCQHHPGRPMFQV
jgi:hypothetical protein